MSEKKRHLTALAAERKAVLALATGAGGKRAKRGAASNVRQGAAFEALVDHVCSQVGHVARGHPESKVVRGAHGPRTVYTAKNGVDFVGVVYGMPVAIEAKRLPGAASLSGAKDDSTRWEATWLLRFREKRGRGAFLVYDPEAASGDGVVYVVREFATLAVGGAVKLRTPGGSALVTAFTVRVLEDAVTRAVAWVATGSLP